MKTLRRAVTVLLATTMMGALAPPAWSAEESGTSWKQTLSELWSATKAKTQEVFNPANFRPKQTVQIGIAYGTEKEKWLKWAVEEFAKTEAGKYVKIDLIPMGSIDGAQAVLRQDKRINAWSPASSIVQELLVEPWQREHGNDPIASDAPLALTPMVYVMWQDRYDAFIAKFQELNFKTIAQALEEPTGWAAIASKPEWGMFTFGHTNPTESNSGLLSLVLMAYDYFDVMRGLKPEQIMEAGFLDWLKKAEGAMDTEQTSTGKLMTQMLRFGPSTLNGVMVYENLALSNLGTAEGRWGKIKVVYPKRSVWNDNPYYVLDVPWSSPEQREAATLFRNFLLTKEVQKVARDQYLFRPASVDVPIIEPGSAFSKLEGTVQVDVPAIRRPSAEVLTQLIQIWKRVH
jgi:ABC-type Fe3+ transport system substrate-binding protein